MTSSIIKIIIFVYLCSCLSIFLLYYKNQLVNRKYINYVDKQSTMNHSKISELLFNNIYERKGVFRYQCTRDNNPVTFDEFIELLREENRDSNSFFIKFIDALKDASTKFSAYFFECPPVSYDTKGTIKFEFTVTKSKLLSNVKQDFSSFLEHFNGEKRACSFENIGRDATLIVPIPVPSNNEYVDYKSLSDFTKNAEPEQQRYFWRKVAQVLSDNLESDGQPRWLSTNGLGVHYLHMRVDKRPKYYTFQEFIPWKAASGDEKIPGNEKS